MMRKNNIQFVCGDYLDRIEMNMKGKNWLEVKEKKVL